MWSPADGPHGKDSQGRADEPVGVPHPWRGVGGSGVDVGIEREMNDAQWGLAIGCRRLDKLLVAGMIASAAEHRAQQDIAPLLRIVPGPLRSKYCPRDDYQADDESRGAPGEPAPVTPPQWIQQ